jgi:hypothetical protein
MLRSIYPCGRALCELNKKLGDPQVHCTRGGKPRSQISVNNRTSALRGAWRVFFTSLLYSFVCTVFNVGAVKRANKVTQIFLSVPVLVSSYCLI